MKFIKFIVEFIQNIRKYILEGFLYFFLYVCYQKIIGANGALILTVFLVLYGATITISNFAKEKLIFLERQNNVTPKKLFYFSIFILCPIYLFWLLISVIPIISYEAWFITGFPIMVVCSIPCYVVSEYWKSASKIFFWLLQLSVYSCCFILGQFLGNYFWRVFE